MKCLFSRMVLGMECLFLIESEPTGAVSLANEFFSGVVTVLQMQYVYHMFPSIYIFDLSVLSVICLYMCKEGVRREDPERPGPTEKSLPVCLMMLPLPHDRNSLVVIRKRKLRY